VSTTPPSDATGTASALTPEARAAAPGLVSRELGRLGPGSRVFEVLKRAGIGVFNDGFIHAGNLAYLALMTLFPFFITAAALLSLFGQSRETQRAVGSFLRYMPHDVSALLQKPIADVLAARTGNLLWLGGLVGLWTVSGFVETIRDIFRRAYGTTSSAPFWRTRLTSTGVVIGSVLVAMLSFLAQGVLTAAEQVIYRLFPWAQHIAGWIGLSRLIPAALMFGALYVLFYAVTPSKYRYGASRKWPGALFTTVWWVGMTALLPAVLGELGGYNLTYGSLAGVVVMLLFFYVVGLGFVFGAQLNAALAEPREAALEGGGTARAAGAV
jgi:membrane protein